MRVAVFAGVRPQFIKAAIIQESASKRQDLSLTLVNLGQHYSPVLVTDAYGAQPEFDATLMPMQEVGNSTTDRVRTATRRFLESSGSTIDIGLVIGDADCSVGAAEALAAARVQIAHLEAGVRGVGSAEFANAYRVDQLASHRLATSKRALSNLANEGLSAVMVGDVYLDFVLQQFERITATNPLGTDRPYVLVSGHHMQSAPQYSEVLRSVVEALRPGTARVVAVDHPKFGLQSLGVDGVEVVQPMPHLELLGAIHHAACVATDSGGIQREAYFLGTRCVLLQEHPWWPELVEAGHHRAVGHGGAQVGDGLRWALSAGPYIPDLEPFGGGVASSRILDYLATI